ncbi:hypothetical protein [Hymenobacter koreensis]|uniref:DNA cytosine methyltransferase n=1 Tax=Hymenobacter koreensis TaxID=1084523 RepID=A0ABP8JN43_9BACT
MKVLVACEYSGIVRDAFLAAGHDAMSCDLLPTESPGPHYQGDVRDILHNGWDLLIAHPECTYLTISANGWLKEQPPRKSGALVGAARLAAQEEAAAFFMEMINAPVPRIAVENPIGIMSTLYQPPSQIIQPWQFGHGETKGTCLWLKNLPGLLATDIVPGREPKTHFTGPGKTLQDRRKARSKFFPGIAAAMAAQWGDPERLARLGIQQQLFAA